MKKLYLIIAVVLFGTLSMFASYTITKFPTTAFCSSYPSAYVTGSFSINEGSFNSTNGFTRGQTSGTLVFTFNNSNYQFNPGVGTVTVTNSGLTVNSYTITATTITVNLTSASTNTVANVLHFNGVQVRAAASGTGYIRRSGGTFRIDNRTTRPNTTTSLGDFSSAVPLAYSSSTSTQTVTTSVFSGTTNNQILRAQIVITGTCTPISVSALNFNTTGSTAASTDILNAKLYSTGTSTTFATTTLFGTTTNPNGAFTINGSQTLSTAGTYNFWLTYDIKPNGVSIPGDLVDAQFLSSVVSGNTNVPTVTNPAGSRTISANSFFSIAGGNWSNTANWSRTQGGAPCTCAPTGGTGDVYVNNAVSLDNSYTVNNVTVQSGGSLSNAATRVLTTLGDLSTTGNGVFSATTAWAVNNVITLGTGASTSSSALALTGNLSVGSGTTLTMTGGVGLTVNGNINVDGTLALGASNVTNSNAAGTTVSGTGSITGSGVITLGANKDIPASTNLTIAPSINIANNITVTNNGTVNMQNSITGGNTNSKWINAAGSVLNMGGTTSALLATGTLDAIAVPNTINFSGSGAQTITTPMNGAFYHLILNSSASSSKSLSGAIIVNGDITISSSAQLNAAAAANTIDIYGNWVNNSSNATPFNPSTSTVFFKGTSDSLLGSGVNNFNDVDIFTNGLLIANNATGKLVINGNWINDGDFLHNGSDVTFNGTSTISGVSITAFNTINVNATKTLTLHATETDLDGNITCAGNFNHNNGLVVFNGNGNTQNINGGASALTFYQLALDNASGSLVLGRPVTVNNALTLTSGTLTLSSALTMANATTIFRDLGTLSAAPTFGTSVDLNYVGTTNVTTGFEVPSTTTVLGNLVINKSGGITLGANATVNTNVTFTSGLITTGANKLTLANAATVTGAGAGKYVFGNLEKGIAASTALKTFEVGDASSYTPIDLTFGGAATNGIGKITASSTAGDNPQIATSGINVNKSVNRFWTLTNNGVTFGSYTGKFTFVAGDIDAGSNTAAFTVARYNGSAWSTTTNGARTALTTQFIGGNSTTFGDFQVGEVGVPPSVTCPSNIVQGNDAGLCTAVVNYTATIAGSPAPTTTYVLTGATIGSGSGTATGLVFNKGVTTVQLTVSNVVGSNTCSFTVSVNDTESPVAPTLANISGECSATAVAPTTTDNCAGTITASTTDPLIYSTQGTHIIHWTFDDTNGNAILVNQNVIIDDVTPPVTPTLADITGECSATAVAPTTTDNCAGTITASTTDPLIYSTQGTHIIHWTFDDNNGNAISVNQNVIIDDITPPVTPTLADITGECSATAVAPTTTDNCAGTITASTTDPLIYSTQGAHIIHWTFDDNNGNAITANQNVIIDDVTPPVTPTLADITGECSATAVAPTTTDNCAGTITGTTTDPLIYSTQGTNVIHWTFDDNNGNAITVNQNVIIHDVTSPVTPTLADIAGECSATAVAPTTTDNCAGTITGSTTDPLIYSTQGTNVIHWTFDDNNGNVITLNQNVIIDDVTPPVTPTLADIIGECSATAVAPTTTDNCAGTITAITTDPLIYSTQGTHIIHWTFDDNNGNVITVNQNVIILDVTNPTISAPADINVCNGDLIVLGTPITSDNCGLADVSNDAPPVFPAGTTVVTWTVTDNAGNSSTASQNVTINAVPVGSANDIVICNATASNLTLNSTIPSTSFTWTSSVTLGGVTGNSNCASGCGGVINDVLTNTGNVHSIVEYTVTPVSALGCTGTTFVTTVTVGAIPAAPVIVGPHDICGLPHPIYAANSAEATSYNWTVPSGLTIASGQGTSSITLNVSGNNQFGNISCTASNNCGTGLSTDYTYAKKPFAATPIVGPSSLCGMSTATYSTSSIGATSFAWTLPVGISITSGSGTSSINVSIAPTFMAGVISVIGVNACGSVPGASLTIVGKSPAASSAIAGPTSLCGLSTMTYTATGIQGCTSYVWTLPNGLTQLSASGNSITVQNTGYVSGNISVQGVNGCGIGLVKTLILTAATTTPGLISGPTVTCGMTSAAYSVVPVANATSYNWTLPAGASIAAGLGTNSIVASFTSGLAGTVSVMANNGCANSVARSLLVSKIPAIPGVIAGPTVICGLGTAAYSIASVAGATSYLWATPAGVSIASGQGTNSVVVNVASTAFASGLIRVYAQTACGNSAYRGLTFGACASPTEMNVTVEEKDNMFSRLYPNPTTNEFSIDVTTSEERAVVVEVYDVLGNVVKHELHQLVSGTSTMKTNIENNQNGIYFVRVLDVDNNVLYTQRVVKQ